MGHPVPGKGTSAWPRGSHHMRTRVKNMEHLPSRESSMCGWRSGHPPPPPPPAPPPPPPRHRRGLRDIFNSGKPLAGNISFALDILSAFFPSEKKCVAHMRPQRRQRQRRRHGRNIYYVDVDVCMLHGKNVVNVP